MEIIVLFCIAQFWYNGTMVTMYLRDPPCCSHGIFKKLQWYNHMMYCSDRHL